MCWSQVEAVTKGVCVRAAVVFQLDDPMMGGRGFLFAYRHALHFGSPLLQPPLSPQHG